MAICLFCSMNSSHATCGFPTSQVTYLALGHWVTFSVKLLDLLGLKDLQVHNNTFEGVKIMSENYGLAKKQNKTKKRPLYQNTLEKFVPPPPLSYYLKNVY